MRSLGIFIFTSTGAGYVALNSIPAELNLQLLEFCPLGQRSQMLILGEWESVLSFSKLLTESDLVKSHTLRNIQQPLLDAYFSLSNNKIQRSILIVESPYLGDLLLVGNEAVLSKVQIVDLRFPRVPESIGHLILTSDKTENLLQIREELNKNSICTHHFLREVSPQFREFFEVRS